MKAIVFLFTLAALFATRAEAQISLDLNLDPRATYEALAERANLNVVFGPGVRTAAAAAFHAENLSVRDALNLLAKQTATFWMPWDKKTILVFEDTLQNRRDFERQFLQALPLGPRSQSGAIEELRDRGLKWIAAGGAGNTILIRETETQIRLAESIIANTSESPAVLDVDGLYFAETGSQRRTPESIKTQINVKSTGPVSLNVNESSRAAFETLARNGELNILFGGAFRPTNVRFAVKDVALLDALDLLSIGTTSFWQLVSENTIVVMEDTPQNRRDFELHEAETIYLPAGTSTNRLNEILTNLRTMLSARGIFQSENANAIFVHDTPGRLMLTEAMIAAMTGVPIRKKLATDIRTSFAENKGGSFFTAASDRAKLQMKATSPISFSMTGDSRQAFESLASVAGLHVVFKAGFRPQMTTFALQNTDFIEMLDLLTLQTGTFWQTLDAHTILVLEDNQRNRRDYETHLIKTLYLPKETTINQLNGILNVLRTALGVRGIFQNEEAKAIVIHDTPQRVALVETVIEHLNTSSTPIKSVDIPAPYYAENAIYGYAAAARPELKPKSAGPVSINLNQPPRVIYEALGSIAGVNVNFSPDFPTGSAVPFHVEGVDVLDAVDYLSLATDNSWKIVDPQTILVMTGSRRDLQTPVTKTFYIANRTSQNTVNAIANLLRTALVMRAVDIGDGAITIQETPQRMAVAEKIIASLDRVP
jgi:hypothetical protein